jgi:cereblon
MEDDATAQPEVEEEEVMEDESQSESVTFDTTLPGTHSYLGRIVPPPREKCDGDGGDDAQRALRRLGVLPVGTRIEDMLLIPLTIVLFPGERVPLRQLSLHYSEAVKAWVKASCTGSALNRCPVLGMINKMRNGWFERVGTTASVEFVSEPGDAEVRFVARGCQRFRLWTFRIREDGVAFGKATILDDGPSVLAIPRAMIERPARLGGYSSRLRWSCVMSAHPPWIGDVLDVPKLAAEARRLLAQSLAAPQSVDDLVLWLIAHLPLDRSLRQSLLEERSTALRLYRIVLFMRGSSLDSSWLCCARCLGRNRLALARERFDMTTEGATSAFVNPMGVVFQVTTVRHVRGISLDHYTPSEESSWFPGYAWTIAYCGVCHVHLGWRFDCIRQDLQPVQFWGLATSAIRVIRADTENSQSVFSTDAVDKLNPFPIFVGEL